MLKLPFSALILRNYKIGIWQSAPNGHVIQVVPQWKEAYIIDHRRCNKYVRQRVSDKPELIMYSHSVREANRHAYLMDLQLSASGSHLLMSQRDYHLCVSAGVGHVPCDVKIRRLTMKPFSNAPNAPTMESYEENDEVIP